MKRNSKLKLKQRKLKQEIKKRTWFNNWYKEFDREKTFIEKVKIYFSNLFKWK